MTSIARSQSALLSLTRITRGRWQAAGGLLWGDDDSDVDFQDSEVTSASLSVLHRFVAR